MLRPVMRVDLVTRQVDDDFFIYDPVSDRVVMLNLTSAFVFDMCDGTRTKSEVASQVAATFGVDRARARVDVEEVLRNLIGAGLLDRTRDRVLSPPG